MSEQEIVFFDVETGGLNPAVHPIIQIAAVVVDEQFRELESVEMKLRFDEKQADASALLANGYSPEIWKREAIDSSLALGRIDSILRAHATYEKISARGKSYSVARLGAHNARFDCDFLAAWFKAAGMFCPAAIYEPLCTLNLARWCSLFDPHPPADHKLETLCRWLDIQHAHAHDALADVRATVDVASALVARCGLWRAR